MTSCRILVHSCIAFCLLVSPLMAAPPEQKEIMELYRRGLGGDAKAVEECIAKLEAVLKTQPSNQLARVYLGSALTLRSRDLGFGPKKLQTLKQGVAVMDEAVAAAPNEAKVRLARALTTSALPSIFGHGASARQDFLLLAKSADTSANELEPGDLQVIYYQAGLAEKRAGNRHEAKTFLQKALQYDDDPVLTKKVRSAVGD
jgi:tetratricopeptide (TPR) repeat protein